MPRRKPNKLGKISMWFIWVLPFLNLPIRLFPDTNESITTDGKNRFRPDLLKLNISLLCPKIDKAPKRFRIIVFDQMVYGL